jgi:hypothetical protein
MMEMNRKAQKYSYAEISQIKIRWKRQIWRKRLLQWQLVAVDFGA